MHYCLILFNLLLTCWLAYVATVDIEQIKKDKPPFIFKKFINCEGESEHNYPLTFHDITMDQSDKNTFIINGLIKVREDLGPEVIGKISANHCKDVNNPDSCEYLVQDYEFGDVCDLLSDSNGEWHYFTDHLKLPRHCPIPAGTYKIDNFQSLNVFGNKLAVPEGLWKIEISCLIDDVTKGCAYLEVLM